MVQKTIFLLFLQFFLGPFIRAQSAFGIEVAINNDLVSIKDPGNAMRATPRLNISKGFTYRYSFKNGFSLRSGLILKAYPQSMAFSSPNFQTAGTGNMVVQLPVTLGYNWMLLEDRIYVSPFAGCLLNGMLFYDQGISGGGKVSGGGDTLTFQYTFNDAHRFFVSSQLGLLMGFNAGRHFCFEFFARYHFSFSPISRQSIVYRHNSAPAVNAEQQISGSYFSYLGLNLYFRPGR